MEERTKVGSDNVGIKRGRRQIIWNYKLDGETVKDMYLKGVSRQLPSMSPSHT